MTPSCRGDRIAYSRRRFSVNIWAAVTDGLDSESPIREPADSAVRLIFSSQRDHSPQFSPDGRQVVFASDRSGAVQLWRSDADGNNAVQLSTTEPRSIGTPRWSPDGSRIAFDARLDADDAEIYTMRRNGADVRRITHNPSADMLPSWSHDGR